MALEALNRYLEQIAHQPGWRQVVRHAWIPTDKVDGHQEIFPDFHPTLTAGDLLEMYAAMVTSRKVDDREVMLQQQGQVWFSIAAAGKEAALAAAGKVLRPTDPIWGYYRDRTLAILRGTTIHENLMQSVAAAADPASGG